MHDLVYTQRFNIRSRHFIRIPMIRIQKQPYIAFSNRPGPIKRLLHRPNERIRPARTQMMRSNKLKSQPYPVSTEYLGAGAQATSCQSHEMRRLQIGRRQNIRAAACAAECRGRLSRDNQPLQALTKGFLCRSPFDRQTDRAKDHAV
ncbi:hypothetical protein D3C80_1565850 [compost metagenome]